MLTAAQSTVETSSFYFKARPTRHDVIIDAKGLVYLGGHGHMLATPKQDAGESVDEFILRINKLSQNCDFTAVSAQEYKDHMKRDSFINGLSSNFIRQRLLENRNLTFTEAHEKARSIELAKLNCETYAKIHLPDRCALSKKTKPNRRKTMLA